MRQAGPISKNFKSSKKDGLAPSILCPINCPIHAITKRLNEISSLRFVWLSAKMPRKQSAVKCHTPTNMLKESLR